MRILFLALCSAVFGLCTVASADTVTYCDTVYQSLGDVAPAVPAFDMPGCELLGADVILSLGVSG